MLVSEMETLEVPSHLALEDADFSKAVAYVNGEIGPYADAKISVRDIGFLKGDMVYDVLHVWKGGFFRLEDHLDRFARSMSLTKLDPRLSRDEIRNILTDLVARSTLRDAVVYLSCTRGVPPLGSDDLAKCVPTFVAHVRPLISRANREQVMRGMSLQIDPNVRRIPNSSVDARAKNPNRGDLIRGTLAAREAGFDSTLLLSHSGYITEGTTYNVMAIIDGELITPDENVLQGVSAKTMIELAPELGIPARYGKIRPEDLYRAEEVFITSTSIGLFPVTKVDNVIFGNGRAGPKTVKLLNHYYNKKDAGWNMTPIDYGRLRS